MDLSTSRYGRLKYTIKVADLVALGASLTGTITLDSLPPATVIYSIFTRATTAVSGGAISALTAQATIGGTNVGAAVSVFNTTGAVGTTATLGGATPLATAANTFAVLMTATGANLNAVTAGQFDIIINYTSMAA